LTRNTNLGKNTNFNGLTIIGEGHVSIGDNFHSGSECLILTDIHDYDNGEAIPYGTTYIVKDVKIADNVWIGSRVTILGGVQIGEGAIIQAGAVVVSDIPKYGIAGGSPARVFKQRNAEHYERLKAERKFH
jgi:acetyltransferase-like isoleucine patch superfamily enzyme